jgi:hypothetical protein
LFVHAFSGHYLNDVPASDSSKEKQKKPFKTKQYERAKFIGEQMKKDRIRRLDYEVRPIYGTTHKGERKIYKPLLRRGVIVRAGGGAMRRAAQELATDIKRLVQTKRYL